MVAILPCRAIRVQYDGTIRDQGTTLALHTEVLWRHYFKTRLSFQSCNGISITRAREHNRSSFYFPQNEGCCQPTYASSYDAMVVHAMLVDSVPAVHTQVGMIPTPGQNTTWTICRPLFSGLLKVSSMYIGYIEHQYSKARKVLEDVIRLCVPSGSG